MADSDVPTMTEATSAAADDVLYLAKADGVNFLDRYIKRSNLIPAGSITYMVEGVPDAGLGENGNYAENVLTGDVYGPKTAGAWGSPVFNRTGESWYAKKQTVAIVSGVVTLDCADGLNVHVPWNANITDFVITGWPADGLPNGMTFFFHLGAGGPYTIAWAALATTKIRADGGGVLPALPEDEGATLIATIYSDDDLDIVTILLGGSDIQDVP